MVQNRLVLIIHFLRAQNEKFYCMEPEPEPPGAAFFCLEPEPTQVGRSRSRLRDLGDLEPEPPKKVAAPQHWIFDSSATNGVISFSTNTFITLNENP